MSEGHVARQPLISVIIPVYNGEAYLGTTLEALLSQTYREFEAIVIDDGSTDGTREVLARYLDPRLRLHTFQNAGVAESRNRGLALATGDYVSFLDADDLWHPDKLAAQLSALEEHSEAAVAYSWTHMIDSDGQLVGRCSHAVEAGDVLAALLESNFLTNGSNPLIRKHALDEVGGFDARYNPAEDWDLWLRLAARRPYACVPAVHVYYRVHRRSMSLDVRHMERGVTRVIERAFGEAPPALAHLKPRALANLYRYLAIKALEGPATRETARLSGAYMLGWLRRDRYPTRNLPFKLLLLVRILSLAIYPSEGLQNRLYRLDVGLRRWKAAFASSERTATSSS